MVLIALLQHYYTTTDDIPFHAGGGECQRGNLGSTYTAQPCIIVRGQLVTEFKDAVLVIEKKFVTTFDPKEAPLLLLGAFYVFNMHYTEGCINLYTFFEVVFF